MKDRKPVHVRSARQERVARVTTTPRFQTATDAVHERAAESTGTPARPRRTYPSPQDELLHRARTAPSTTRRLIAGGVLR